MCRAHAHGHGAPAPPEYPQRSETVEHPLLPRITDLRLDRFFTSNYASQHLDKLLDRVRIDSEENVQMTVWHAPGDSKPGFAEGKERVDAEGKTLKKGDRFGPSWTNHWVKLHITLPAEMRSLDQKIIFEFDPSCEALIFLPDSTPVHGLTGGPNTMKDGKPGEQEDRRVEHIIPAEAVKRGTYDFYIEVTANLMFGLGTYRYLEPDPNISFPLISADIVVPNLQARGLRNDFRLLTEVARHPDVRLYGLSQRALKAADDVMNRFKRFPIGPGSDLRQVDDMLLACREIAWTVLGDLDEEGKKETCIWNPKEKQAKIWTIGHCHIDTAWLWRYTQTQQKVARSWTTQCDLMDRWPNHQFCASSAQQYKWLEDLYPKGFDRVKSYIDQGRFHYVGGAWLEHDCMMPSGESLVRQYLYGQRYFRSRFGAYCREAWLPDTFGYASQLPQILRLAGLQYFFTQKTELMMKIGWNNINVFPYSTFNWVGLDGSQVLAHMTPVDQYNGQCHFGEVIKGVRDNKNLEVTDSCLYLIGNGDGGGGPTPLMLEKLERLSSLSEKDPIVPSLKMGSPIDFFDDLCESTQGGKILPTWRGELYLELHRGTYTTQTKIKAGNRDMETMMRDIEYFATLASLADPSYRYPQKQFDEMWQDIMLGQFHDCLPGTTINTVVQDNLNIYEKCGKQGEEILKTALFTLVKPGQETTVLDPLRLQRDEVYKHNEKLVWLHTNEHGVGSLSTPSLVAPKAATDGDSHSISNDRFTITIASGRITSIYDKLVDRELIVPGPREDDGGLVIYEDLPLTYDAWDAEIYHLKCSEIIRFDSVRTVEDPLRASLVASASFGQSSAEVTISLDAINPEAEAPPLIRVNVKIDWHEQHRFLKFVLPVDVHASNAIYGTQFGTIERPTHRNTRFDQAKFEVCAHGYGDLSEANYGVAIACRDKYGYTVEGNTMRAPTSPDPQCDQGKHDIDFAIIPHTGQLAESNVHIEAMKFNNRPYVLQGTVDLPNIRVSGPGSDNIVLETIKRGEDDVDGKRRTIVMRMYEAIGGKAKGVLDITGIPIRSVTWVDILEEPLEGKDSKCACSKSEGGSVKIALDFKVFEIKTLLLELD